MNKIIDHTMPNHPCFGIECSQCTKCIFDEELFPQDKEKEEKKEDETRYCDACPHLEIMYTNSIKTAWNCVCKAKTIRWNNSERYARILCNAQEFARIPTPDYCPLIEANKKVESKTKDMYLESYTPQYKQNLAPYKKTQRELVEEMTPTLTMNELEIGKLYVIPAYSFNETKVIRVVSKYPNSISYKEINNLNTMDVSSYTYTLFGSSVEMNIITPYKSF